MKVLHISTGQEGGAAWCARRISYALRKQGIESQMLFGQGKSMPAGVEGAIAEKDAPSSLYSNWLLSHVRYHVLERLPWYIDRLKLQEQMERANTSQLYLHQPLSEFRNIAQHPLVEWADIIHLHWVPDFVDYPTFFRRVKKPIVWTLHDKYPAMGVQHYCSEFSPVPDNLKELDDLCKKIKRKGVLQARNLHIVAISEMMQRICAESDVLKGLPCSLIHNGVDTEIFQPQCVNRLEVLSRYTDQLEGVSDKTQVYMFSSYGIWDKNKGLNRVIEAMEKVDGEDRLLIAVGGIGNEEKTHASFPIIYTGMIKEQSKIAELYTIANYFFLASYEETFAQTPLEAMACGTPVISSPCSGASDLIRDFNGVVCRGFTSDAIAAGIQQAIHTRYDSTKIRQYILANYDYPKIAGQYIELYKEILK